MVNLSIGVEPLGTCIGELDNLLHEYWKATDAHKGVPPLAMDWTTLQECEKRNAFVVLVARSSPTRRVLGFSQYSLVYHPHHRTTRVAFCDILAVRLNERGQGLGRALVKAGEEEMRKRGAKLLVHCFRLVYDVKPFFPEMGYVPFETQYMKVL